MQRQPAIKKVYLQFFQIFKHIRSKNQITRKNYNPEDESSALTKACNGDDDNDESHLAPAVK